MKQLKHCNKWSINKNTVLTSENHDATVIFNLHQVAQVLQSVQY